MRINKLNEYMLELQDDDVVHTKWYPIATHVYELWIIQEDIISW